MTDEIAERVIQLAAGTFGVERSTLSVATTDDDVDSWDSFAQLNLMVGIEDEFDIELDPEQIAELHDLGALIDCVVTVVGS